MSFGSPSGAPASILLKRFHGYGLGESHIDELLKGSFDRLAEPADSAGVAPSPPGRADGAAGPGTGVVGPAAGGATEAGVGVVVLDTAGTSVLGTAGGVVVGAAGHDRVGQGHQHAALAPGHVQARADLE